MSEHIDLPPHEDAPEQLSDLAANSLTQVGSEVKTSPHPNPRTDQIESLGTNVAGENFASRI